MNKINPLYALAFFIFMAILTFVMSHNQKEAIAQMAQKNALLEQEGKNIAALKSQWSDAKVSKKRIDKILLSTKYSPYVTDKGVKKRVYFMELSNLDKRHLDGFINAMLNESVSLKQLHIERISDKNATVVMECRL